MTLCHFSVKSCSLSGSRHKHLTLSYILAWHRTSGQKPLLGTLFSSLLFFFFPVCPLLDDTFLYTAPDLFPYQFLFLPGLPPAFQTPGCPKLHENSSASHQRRWVVLRQPNTGHSISQLPFSIQFQVREKEVTTFRKFYKKGHMDGQTQVHSMHWLLLILLFLCPAGLFQNKIYHFMLFFIYDNYSPAGTLVFVQSNLLVFHSVVLLFSHQEPPENIYSHDGLLK